MRILFFSAHSDATLRLRRQKYVMPMRCSVGGLARVRDWRGIAYGGGTGRRSGEMQMRLQVLEVERGLRCRFARRLRTV